MTTIDSQTRLTSLCLKEIGRQVRAGRHVAVSGAIGDHTLLLGDPAPLAPSLIRLLQGGFDIVVRVNAADGICVVKGATEIERLDQRDDPSTEDEGADVADTDRDRRLREVRERIGSSTDVVTRVRQILTQNAASALVVFEQTDIALQDPNMSMLDRQRVAELQIGLTDAASVGRHRNTAILLTAQANGLPAAMLAACETLARVDVGAPTRGERETFLNLVIGRMHGGGALGPEARRKAVQDFARLTDGDALVTLDCLAILSAAGRHSALDPKALVDQFRFGDRPDHWADLRDNLDRARNILQANIFGQDDAIEAVMGVLAARGLGLRMGRNSGSLEQQPATLVMLGPTGVGKTEMAKMLALVAFGDSEAYQRFDMASFQEPHSAGRLFGASPGYVGFEQGGELTNALLRRPNSVVLFDEIEKAHIDVLKTLLSVVDDGRIADGQGRVAHFGEAIIVFTSNIGAKELAALRTEGEPEWSQVKDTTVGAFGDHFARHNVPELAGRLNDGVVAFDFLRPPVVEKITMKFVASMGFDHGPGLQLDSASTCAFTQRVMADPVQSSYGGRQIRNVLQQRIRSLSSWLALNDMTSAGSVTIQFEGDTMLASVDGAQPIVVHG